MESGSDNDVEEPRSHTAVVDSETERTVTLLIRHMEGLEDEISWARADVSKLRHQLDEGDSIKKILDDVQALREILPKVEWLRGVIDSSNTDDVKERILGAIEAKEKLLQLKEIKLEEKHAAFDLSRKQLLEFKSGQHGIERHDAEAGNTKSGLVYVQATHRIGTQSIKNIGLVERKDFKKKISYGVAPKVEITPPCQELRNAWGVISRAMHGQTSEQFVEQFLEHVPLLDRTSVKNAWKISQLEFQRDPSATNIGEMTFQQLVYAPFSVLFMAAAGGWDKATYIADQNVSSSLSAECKMREEDKFQSQKISMYPDSAVTLQRAWDAFGMMEIKKSKPKGKHEYLVDNDKCVLMTAITAIVLSKCIHRDRYGQVALPFIIATGTLCSLYVTTLDENGNPLVRVVGYPGGQGHARNKNCNKSPSEERNKMFLALAVLLNKFKTLFDSETEEQYYKLASSDGQAVDGLPTLSFGSFGTKRKEGGSNSTNPNSSSKPRRSAPSGKSEEQAAKEAAACGEKFIQLEYPFDRFLHFTDSGVYMDEQKKSPFYFKCQASPSSGLADKKIFLKVWKVDDNTDFLAVELEWKNHQTAFETGVPVACPVLPELTESMSLDGTKYLVFAVEYIPQDSIADPWVLLQFCVALIETVEKLHNQAGLLHCDLKPDNIRWNEGHVKLIDFGHSQIITEATWCPGTRGFEAPEILDGKPNSRNTDAFSVGQTILTVLERLENGWQLLKRRHVRLCNVRLCHFLREIGKNLAKNDPETRWSLTAALNELRLLLVNKDAIEKLEYQSSLLPPPNKVAKVSTH